MLTVWREPQGHVPYCIGVDTAEGLVHGDYSCAQVLEVRTGGMGIFHLTISLTIFICCLYGITML